VSLDLIDALSPHRHFVVGTEGRASQRLTGTWLLVVAITIHNLPEGLAVGVGFGEGDVGRGLTLATAIGL
jgi:ZIP family zinc transporter